MPKGVGYPSSPQHKRRTKLGQGLNERPRMKRRKKRARG